MKRFHVNMTVDDLAESTRFYSMIFGSEPTVLKEEYAKWMLDDPRINFSIATGGGPMGINHVGIQADNMEELGEIQDRLKRAGAAVFDQPIAECCYARSSKSWVRDPSDLSWEAFVTFGENTVYGEDRAPQITSAPGSGVDHACCSQDRDDCCSAL